MYPLRRGEVYPEGVVAPGEREPEGVGVLAPGAQGDEAYNGRLSEAGGV